MNGRDSDSAVKRPINPEPLLKLRPNFDYRQQPKKTPPDWIARLLTRRTK